MKKEDLKIVEVDPKSLKVAEYNPRQMTEKQVIDLTESIRRFGMVDPLIVNRHKGRENTVIGGHQRLKIAVREGFGTVPVVYVDLDEKRECELNLRLNKNLGEWDWGMLANFDEEILKDIGFSGDELDQAFGLETADDFDEQKEFEKAVKEPRGVKDGDLWQLGDHKLIIGDCTKKENWEEILGDERFDLMETDPPYRLAYAKKLKKGLGTKKIKTKTGFGYKQQRSYLGVEMRGNIPEYDEWLSIANDFQNQKGANVMIFEFWKNIKELWNAIEKYWKIKNIIIWHTPNRHQGFGMRYQFFNKYDIAPLAGEGKLNQEFEQEMDKYLKESGQKILDSYEVILYGQQGKSNWDRKKGRRWEMATDCITYEVVSSKNGSIIFGAKPIQILVPYIKILSPRNGIVMEPFAGSGSTIIASEIMKRKCRAIEISPTYSEVIINRWERFTGLKAELML